MSIRVTKPGLLSTLQDLGRYGYQRFGVVAGGAMDEWSHRMANLLVGNAEDEATLEITLQGPGLTFDETALIAICGADLSPRIGEQPLPQGRPVLVNAGSQLDFGRRQSGFRAYLAVRGGYRVAPVMNSKSTYLRGSFGGFKGRALRKGDEIPIDAWDAEEKYPRFVMALREGAGPFAVPIPPVGLTAPLVVRIIAGRQWEAFGDEARALLVSAEFRISAQSDRMGYRIEGPKLALREALEMISEAVTFGTIQVPPDGNPIILMADRQTTGGYPKIAEVASVDLPLLAQMLPQQALRFALISLERAQQLYVAREQEIRRIRQSLDELKRGE
jgi:antagonist of KipI